MKKIVQRVLSLIVVLTLGMLILSNTSEMVNPVILKRKVEMMEHELRTISNACAMQAKINEEQRKELIHLKSRVDSLYRYNDTSWIQH